MPTTFNYSGKPAFMYDSAEDVWFQIGGAIDTSSGYTWTGAHVFSNDVDFSDAVYSAEGINNFLNPAARDAKFVTPVRGNICFVRQDSGGSALNQIQFYDGSTWVAGGDITAVTGGVGITATNSTGPIPSLAVDTALVATTSNTMTMSNKTLTAPILTGEVTSTGDIVMTGAGHVGSIKDQFMMILMGAL